MPLVFVLALVLVQGCGDGDTGPGPGVPPGDTSSVDTATAARLQTVATGLDFPLHLTAPPGDARLFIVEKSGRIRIVEDGRLLPEPFLDLSDRVSAGSEQGLLGLAFAPHYAASGRFWVNYTDLGGDTRVVAYRVSADPNRADPASEALVLTVEQPFANHNGGHVAVGPDGHLYVALGDGGGGGDPLETGRDPSDLLGSLLRIDPTRAEGGLPYAVPADNPFVGRAGARPELWSVGLRNPWRFAWDRETGDLYVGDVGQNAWEEIDVSPAGTGGLGAGRGADYGWSTMEGAHCFGGSPCDRDGLVVPVLEYSHADGCSVTAGHVYRGAAIPALRGHFFYADFCEGWVRSFRYENGAAVDRRSWPALAPGGAIPGFGEDAAGELYVLDAGGSVHKVVPR
jgi:glucose/arabinose dehydrogenase